MMILQIPSMVPAARAFLVDAPPDGAGADGRAFRCALDGPDRPATPANDAVPDLSQADRDQRDDPDLPPDAALVAVPQPNPPIAAPDAIASTDIPAAVPVSPVQTPDMGAIPVTEPAAQPALQVRDAARVTVTRSVEASLLLRAVPLPDAGGRQDTAPTPATDVQPGTSPQAVPVQNVLPNAGSVGDIVLQPDVMTELGQTPQRIADELVVPQVSGQARGTATGVRPGAALFAADPSTPAPVAGGGAPDAPHHARAADAAVLLRATEHPTGPADPAPSAALPADDWQTPVPAIATTQATTQATAQPLEGDIASFQTAAAPPPSSSPLPTHLQAVPHHATLPPATTPAIVVAVTQSGSGTVDLVLTPEDLGRLRFEVTQTGDQMRIHLTVERPETLDLLRRNADQLLSEFRQAGFAGATLSFAQGGQGGQQKLASAATPQTAPELPIALPSPRPQAQPGGGGGLDLRL